MLGIGMHRVKYVLQLWFARNLLKAMSILCYEFYSKQFRCMAPLQPIKIKFDWNSLRLIPYYLSTGILYCNSSYSAVWGLA